MARTTDHATMRLIRITTGTTSPVSLEEVREYLRWPPEDQMRTIRMHLGAAVEFCERSFSGHRQLCRCTWQAISSGFPADEDDWVVPLPPLNSSTSIAITYYDTDNASQTASSTLYDVVTPTNEPAVIKVKSSEAWPATYTRPDAVTLQFTAGFGGPAKVPDLIRAAICLKTEHLYDPTRLVGIEVDKTIQNCLDKFDYGFYG